MNKLYCKEYSVEVFFVYISKRKRNEDRTGYIQPKKSAEMTKEPIGEEQEAMVDVTQVPEALRIRTPGNESRPDVSEAVETLERITDNSREDSGEDIGADGIFDAEPGENTGEGADGETAVETDPQDLDTVPDTSADMTYSDFLRINTDKGVLRVQTSAGNRSIPLVNVNVEVYKDFSDGRHLFYKVTTNADGVADALELPAPPRENSVLGNGSSPYASYVVKASRGGLVSETVENVPIFSGVKSIQSINMSSAL